MTLLRIFIIISNLFLAFLAVEMLIHNHPIIAFGLCWIILSFVTNLAIPAGILMRALIYVHPAYRNGRFPTDLHRTMPLPIKRFYIPSPCNGEVINLLDFKEALSQEIGVISVSKFDKEGGVKDFIC